MYNLCHAFAALKPHLDEKTRRLVAAAFAQGQEYGLKSQVNKDTGVSFREIRRGIKELKEEPAIVSACIRRDGGGRKKIVDTIPEVVPIIKGLVDSTTRGDPQSPFSWTSKSLRRLANELKNLGYTLSLPSISQILSNMGYRLQVNRKVLEGTNYPDRYAQFEYIYSKVKKFHSKKQPVISIECKKHELIGNFKSNGQEYYEIGNSPKVNGRDFMDIGLGKAIPYGILEGKSNTAYVSVEISHEISVFAVNTIRNWWHTMGSERYPKATRLLIAADCGGSDGYRRKLWHLELSKLAKEIGLNISVSHFPPGTSKWSKIEHRLFSFITMNWRGRPLTSLEVIVNLIGNTTTDTGLEVICEPDESEYPIGIKVSDEELKKIKIKHDDFHGEWNYSLLC
jgi:hypothetical protein